MLEQTIGFDYKGQHYEWELIHTLDEHNLDLENAFVSFMNKCPDKVNDIDMFCGFVMGGARDLNIELLCVPKGVFDEEN